MPPRPNAVVENDYRDHCSRRWHLRCNYLLEAVGYYDGATEPNGGCSEQTNRLLCLYQQQLAELTKQAGDTHDLAVAAKDQADASKTIAENSSKSVD